VVNVGLKKRIKQRMKTENPKVKMDVNHVSFNRYLGKVNLGNLTSAFYTLAIASTVLNMVSPNIAGSKSIKS